MQPYASEDTEIALAGTLFSIVVRDDDQPVGIARVVGDGRVAFLMKDMAVHPHWRGSGMTCYVNRESMERQERFHILQR